MLYTSNIALEVCTFILDDGELLCQVCSWSHEGSDEFCWLQEIAVRRSKIVCACSLPIGCVQNLTHGQYTHMH